MKTTLVLRAGTAQALPESEFNGALRPRGTWQRGAFTLIELLVVIAIIAILAGILLPVLDKAKQRALNMGAINNVRQLTIAWKMYCNDNQGLMPPNPSGEGWPAWVAGEMRDNDDINVAPYTGLDCTNFALLLDTKFSVMGAYIQNPAVFKDPGDVSTWDTLTRVRSFSMNCAVGCTNQGATLGTVGTWRYYDKESDMIAPSPSDLYVFLDEHPDSINDGFLAFAMPPSPSRTTWTDMPAQYHNGACAFAYADGHADLHAWALPNVFPFVNWVVNQTTTPIRNQSANLANNPDILWFASHTTAPASGASASTYYP